VRLQLQRRRKSTHDASPQVVKCLLHAGGFGVALMAH
jgi:hypothetical protein